MTTRHIPIRARIARPIRAGWRQFCWWIFAEGPFESQAEREHRFGEFIRALDEMEAASEARLAELRREANSSTASNLAALRDAVIAGSTRKSDLAVRGTP